MSEAPIDLVAEDVAPAVLAPDAPPRIAGIGYAFAKERGALVRQDGDAMVCVHRAAAGLATLLEVQRLYGDIAFEAVDDPTFESVMQTVYRESASMAADVTEPDDVDLLTLADNAAQVDDLLDTQDDSPVIRLINALLLQAIR
ncbi:MAG: hypothetical protein ABIT09_05590, partial [Croceibacterium sp.]